MGESRFSWGVWVLTGEALSMWGTNPFALASG